MHISAYLFIIHRNLTVSGCYGQLGVIAHAAQRLYQLQHTPAQLRIGNGKKGTVELDALGSGKHADIESAARLAVSRGRRSPFETLEEIFNGDAKNRAYLVEAARADTVRTLLVFLNLLERQPEGLAQLLLTHADKHALHADPAAHMHIDGIRRFSCHA